VGSLCAVSDIEVFLIPQVLLSPCSCAIPVFTEFVNRNAGACRCQLVSERLSLRFSVKYSVGRFQTFEGEAAGFLSYVSVRANSLPAIKGTPRNGCTPSSARSRATHPWTLFQRTLEETPGSSLVGGCIEVEGTLGRLRPSEAIETVAESHPP
jgi:hypothetical protein